jgi:hypothetical protein
MEGLLFNNLLSLSILYSKKYSGGISSPAAILLIVSMGG